MRSLLHVVVFRCYRRCNIFYCTMIMCVMCTSVGCVCVWLCDTVIPNVLRQVFFELGCYGVESAIWYLSWNVVAHIVICYMRCCLIVDMQQHVFDVCFCAYLCEYWRGVIVLVLSAQLCLYLCCS